jgi:hypothetical protein
LKNKKERELLQCCCASDSYSKHRTWLSVLFHFLTFYFAGWLRSRLTGRSSYRSGCFDLRLGRRPIRNLTLSIASSTPSTSEFMCQKIGCRRRRVEILK